MDRTTTLVNRGNNLVALFVTLTGPAYSTERTRIARIVRRITWELFGFFSPDGARSPWHQRDYEAMDEMGWGAVSPR
jgi:hypothetical protein